MLIEGTLLYIATRNGELSPKGVLLGRQNSEGCKNVTCNTFLVHRLADSDEFGMVRGLANVQVSVFGELWSAGPAIPCGDLHQSFTDAAII